MLESVGACQVVERFVAAINKHDVDEICRLMTKDHAFIDGSGQKMVGREAMRDAWAAYFDMMPDYHVTIEQIFCSGKDVGLFGRAAGTFAPKGQLKRENHWEIPAAWRAVVCGTCVAKWHVYADNEPVRAIMAKDL